MALKHTVSYYESNIIRGFLGYLHNHWSRKIDASDPFLISAIYAWVKVESGGFGGIRFNNPFNLHGPDITTIRIVDGKKRPVTRPGPLLRFASLSKGFEALAKVLISAPKAYGYQTALNILKRGGNDAAYEFLAAIAMSQFDAGRYGATDWMTAYDKDKNLLLKAYLNVKGVQLRNPVVAKPKPAPKLPELPRDFNYKVVVRNYLDPWAAGRLYDGRHGRSTVDARSSRG